MNAFSPAVCVLLVFAVSLVYVIFTIFILMLDGNLRLKSYIVWFALCPPLVLLIGFMLNKQRVFESYGMEVPFIFTWIGLIPFIMFLFIWFIGCVSIRHDREYAEREKAYLMKSRNACAD